MTIDFDRFPLLDAYDRQILAKRAEVLVFVAAAGTITVHFPIGDGDTTLTGLAPDHRDQFMVAAREAGATVVDCRPCDYDIFLLTALFAPFPAIGPCKRLWIDGSRDWGHHGEPSNGRRDGCMMAGEMPHGTHVALVAV